MVTQPVSKETQKNWWIDAVLFGSAVFAALSGIYFLYLPVNGFQGGRNPMADVRILFTRQTWDLLHTWSGVFMILAGGVHLAAHWPWVTGMVRRTWNELNGKCGCMNPRGRWNLVLNTVAAISFLLCSASGVYFLFVPGGRWAADPMLLFPRTVWDMIHTWAGVTLIAAAIIHFAIHWRWVARVTGKMIGMAAASRQTIAYR